MDGWITMRAIGAEHMTSPTSHGRRRRNQTEKRAEVDQGGARSETSMWSCITETRLSSGASGFKRAAATDGSGQRSPGSAVKRPTPGLAHDSAN